MSFTETHFDRNRYIIRIFIFFVCFCFCFSIGPYGAMQKFWTGPPVQGVPKIFVRKLLFYFVVSNPFHILEVGKKFKSPLPSSMHFILLDNRYKICL